MDLKEKYKVVVVDLTASQAKLIANVAQAICPNVDVHVIESNNDGHSLKPRDFNLLRW